jgi:hypothetical protein
LILVRSWGFFSRGFEHSEVLELQP